MHAVINCFASRLQLRSRPARLGLPLDQADYGESSSGGGTYNCHCCNVFFSHCFVLFIHESWWLLISSESLVRIHSRIFRDAWILGKDEGKEVISPTLLNSGSLPSDWGTRQRPNCTRQSLCLVRHSAKNTRQKFDRQSPLCRVSFIGHSAKVLPTAPGTLGKEKRPSRRRSRWRSLCRVPTLQALGKDFLFF